MRETGFSGDHTAADLLTPGATVAVAVDDPSEEVAGASQDTALVLPSLHQPISPSAPLGTSGQRLDDDVLQQFDATHWLSELTAAWGTFASSFGEKLQVSFSKVLSLDVRLSSVLMSCFSLSLFVQSFSHDHINFFFSSETEKKLSSEVSALKQSLTSVGPRWRPSVKRTRRRKRLFVPGLLRQKSVGMLLSRRP